jgi:L-xylulose 5-phosphate 3-epimerase (EC 5.1.3.22)
MNLWIQSERLFIM